MALEQLIGYSSENLILRVDIRYTTNYFTENFTDNVLTMIRDCDTKCPEYLEIELSNNLDITNFKTICHKICFEMSMGDSLIMSIPLRFMMYLKDYEICDNKIYITIPFKMFCDDITLIALAYTPVKFMLKNAENNFASCKLISKGIFYDAPERRMMASEEQQNIIQYLSSHELSTLQPINEFKFDIPFNGIHKGFFIETENIDSINEIILYVHRSIERFKFDKFLVRTKCIKIHQSLLYLPMNFEKSYICRTLQDFEGSINLSRITVTLNIKFDNLQSKICIYGLSSNLLLIKSGVGWIGFNYSVPHQYSEYNTRIKFVRNNELVCNFIPPTSIHNQQQSNNIHKQITDNNKLFCCITHGTISDNILYMSCSECHNNFYANALTDWFQHNKKTKTCPTCRNEWRDFNMYINSKPH